MIIRSWCSNSGRGPRYQTCGACRPRWSMSAFLDSCPEEVKEQMMMRLDENGENYENLKAKVMFYTFRTVYIVFFVDVCLFRSILCASVFHCLCYVFVCVCVFHSVPHVCFPFHHNLVFKHVRFIFDVCVCVCVCVSFRVCVWFCWFLNVYIDWFLIVWIGFRFALCVSDFSLLLCFHFIIKWTLIIWRSTIPWLARHRYCWCYRHFFCYRYRHCLRKWYDSFFQCHTYCFVRHRFMHRSDCRLRSGQYCLYRY